MPDLALVLSHAARCLPTVTAAVLLESALHRGLLSMHDPERLIASLPRDPRHALARVPADAESGTETTVRWWFEARGGHQIAGPLPRGEPAHGSAGGAELGDRV